MEIALLNIVAPEKGFHEQEEIAKDTPPISHGGDK